MHGVSETLGAVACVLGIFLPGLLLVGRGALPFCGARRMRSCVDFVVRYDECVIGRTREVRR